MQQLTSGDRLWLASRSPDDGHYYFVAVLQIGHLTRNALGSDRSDRFGEYAAVADRSRSHNLGRELPAEALLRIFAVGPTRSIWGGTWWKQFLAT